MEYVGLSVSFCVRDIIGGTNVPDGDWSRVISLYRESYWSMNPDEGERICRLLVASGKIVQPRTLGKPAPNLVNGHWAD